MIVGPLGTVIVLVAIIFIVKREWGVAAGTALLLPAIILIVIWSLVQFGGCGRIAAVHATMAVDFLLPLGALALAGWHLWRTRDERRRRNQERARRDAQLRSRSLPLPPRTQGTDHRRGSR